MTGDEQVGGVAALVRASSIGNARERACLVRAQSCTCDEVSDHDEDGLPHVCHCGGRWHGDYGTASFVSMTYPGHQI